MKNAIVQVTDWLVYVLLAAAVVLAFMAWGVAGAVGVFLAGCVLCASWAALSGIYANSRRSAQLTEQLYDAILRMENRSQAQNAAEKGFHAHDL